MSEVDWSQYLTGNECPLCHERIARSQQWLNCDGWAEHASCHDADAEPGDESLGGPTPTAGIVEMSEADGLWLDWTTAQSGVETPGCNCGHHDGMGVNWHSHDCIGRANALYAKARELHRAAFEAGLLTAQEGQS